MIAQDPDLTAIAEAVGVLETPHHQAGKFTTLLALMTSKNTARRKTVMKPQPAYLVTRFLRLIIRVVSRVAVTLHRVAVRLYAAADRFEQLLLARVLDRHTERDEILAGFAENNGVTFDPDASTFDKLTQLRRAHINTRQRLAVDTLLTDDQKRKLDEVIEALTQAAEQAAQRKPHPEDTK